MFHAQIMSQYWSEIFESVTIIINSVPSSSLSFSTPHRVLFHKDYDYSFFKVLRCKCYPYTRPYASHKLAPHSTSYVFLGYSSMYKGYKYLNLITNKQYISRHVVFDEDSFPFKDFPSLAPSLPSVSTFAPLVVLQPSHQEDTISTSTISQTLPSPSVIPQLASLPFIATHLPVTRVYERRHLFKPLSISHEPSNTPVSTHTMQTRSKAKNLKQTLKALLSTNYSIDHVDLDPTSYTQASKQQHWRDAMATELVALACSNTWSLVPPSEANNIMGCKCVYKIKKKVDGSIERFKSRLVAKGYTQEEGLDYFSLVIKLTTIKLVLSIVVTQN
jgi:Reverse transcriptase (RNA-dependent DNA polymerase)